MLRFQVMIILMLVSANLSIAGEPDIKVIFEQLIDKTRVKKLGEIEINQLATDVDLLSKQRIETAEDRSMLDACSGVMHYLTDNTDQALKHFERAIATKDDPRLQLWLATVLSVDKQYELARSKIEAALDSHPEFAAGHFELACILLNLNDTKGALQSASRAIELKPKYADAYSIRASARFNHRDIFRAEQDARKAISIDGMGPLKNKGVPYMILGGVALAKKDIRQAVNQFKHCIELEPTYAEAYFQAWRISVGVKNFDAAQKYIDALFAAVPDSPKAFLMAVTNYLYLQKFDAALATARDWSAVEPNSPKPHTLAAKALALAGDYDLAVDEIDLALSLAPTDIAIINEKAELLAISGNAQNLAEAKAIIASAKRENTANATTDYINALILMVQGDTQGCAAEVQRIEKKHGLSMPAETRKKIAKLKQRIARHSRQRNDVY